MKAGPESFLQCPSGPLHGQTAGSILAGTPFSGTKTPIFSLLRAALNNGRGWRRPSFKWTAVNLLYYFCDRAQKLRAKAEFALIWINTGRENDC